jgi:uncharacterized protein YyaL (SSP411 family)
MEKDNKTQKDHKYTNALIHESSPYLLQHAHNPVNWYPWGEEALTKAKEENKPLIISIGYSACHWCHVMEHESFEDSTVAAYMNEHFVNIKVDREERPDIDQVYMNAVQLLTGSGGWPLNCITLPDGRPIYGGTYFPKERWLGMLDQVLDFIKNKPEEAEEQAVQLTQGIKASDFQYINSDPSEFGSNDLDIIFAPWESNIDYVHGGHNRAPKFPLPAGYQFLLHYNYNTGNQHALKAVTKTLDKMGEGGIYDQIGGGFARYSTDAHWKVPHFEKMLYDNGQLVSLYSSAYQLTKDPAYKVIVEETLEFIERELMSDEYGFYSALDADSEGEEGKFYVWKKSDLDNVLGKDADLINHYYNVTEHGNWEHGNNILLKKDIDEKVAKKFDISIEELERKVRAVKKKLLDERAKRIRPGLDDKILTSWNGLMLKGYVDAYRVFGKKEYLDMALKNGDFIRTKMMTSEKRLYRNYKEGNASINAFLDDYAFTISAFIALYQATFDEQWLEEASNLTAYTITHFYDEKSGLFYYTSDEDPALITRKIEVTDNVIPAANSEMAKNLYTLGHYFYKDDYVLKARHMLSQVRKNALQGGAYFANWDILLAWFLKGTNEVAIVGEDFKNIRAELDKNYLPNVILMGGKKGGSLSLLENKHVDGQTTIYVCQNKACKMPTTDVSQALKQIVK